MSTHQKVGGVGQGSSTETEELESFKNLDFSVIPGFTSRGSHFFESSFNTQYANGLDDSGEFGTLLDFGYFVKIDFLIYI